MRQFFSPDKKKSPNVSTHREAARSLSRSVFPNREELAQTRSLRTGATSRVQWRTMHVCRSASSGDTERSSHQAAAHMGQGEGGKGREGKRGRDSYRIGYRNRDLAGGGIPSFTHTHTPTFTCSTSLLFRSE